MGIAGGFGAQRRGSRRRSPAWCVHIDPLQRRSLTFLTALQTAFRTSTGSSRSGRQDRFDRGKLLIWQRLVRGGSHGAVRSPGPGSPGPLRSETSARGAFREKVDYSNLNRRSDRMPVYGAGLRRNRGGRRWSVRATATRQFPLHPYSSPQFGWSARTRSMSLSERKASDGNSGDPTSSTLPPWSGMRRNSGG